MTFVGAVSAVSTNKSEIKRHSEVTQSMGHERTRTPFSLPLGNSGRARFPCDTTLEAVRTPVWRKRLFTQPYENRPYSPAPLLGVHRAVRGAAKQGANALSCSSGLVLSPTDQVLIHSVLCFGYLFSRPAQLPLDIRPRAVDSSAHRRVADPAARMKDRQALQGVEVQLLDLIAVSSTAEQWAELLKGPLGHAAREGNGGLALKLVRAGAQAGDALHEAVRGGHGEVVNALLENGASVNAIGTECGKTPLLVAAEEGRSDMVQLLMLKGADTNAVDDHSWTPLYAAVQYGHVAAALNLMAGGADVNARCYPFRVSVIELAVETGHMGILRAAIEHGADVNAVDSQRCTTLHSAAFQDKTEAINVLVEAGANLEARDDSGDTPVHHACVQLNLGALSALVNHGAHVNAQNDDLQTSLSISAQAAGEGAAELVDLLLRSGADETILDNEGKSASDVVADGVDCEDRVEGDIELVFKLLANAPADRTWRRRGYLVLCRAYPDRVRRTQEIRSARDGVPRGIRSSEPEARRCRGNVGGSPVDEGDGAGWASVVKRVLGLQEEGIFRAIVGYL